MFPFFSRSRIGLPKTLRVVLLSDDSPILDLCALIARFDLMIGTRLHSTLIALRAGAPAIHIAYTLKGHDIYADLGLSGWIFGIDEAGFTLHKRWSPPPSVSFQTRSGYNHVRAIVDPVVATNEQALQDALRYLETRASKKASHKRTCKAAFE